MSSAAEKKGKKMTEVTGATQMVKGTRRQQAQVIGQNTPKMQDIPDGKIYFTNRFLEYRSATEEYEADAPRKGRKKSA